jgi:hypothetical protein
LIYIAGAHRSGATPLGAILAGSPEVFFAGELYRIPHPILESPDPMRRCSCGAVVDQCPYWSEVHARLDLEPGMLQSLRRGQLDYERWRRIFVTLWARARRDPRLLDHIARMGRFVQILSETSGARVIVESSYNPLRGLLYQDAASGLEVRYLHLVRDGRSFLGSEQNAKDRLESDWRGLRSTFSILSRWIVYHVLTASLLLRRGPYLRVRFEEFVGTPGPVLRGIGAFAAVDLSGVIEQVEMGDSIPMRHIAAGNRMRLDGAVRLQHQFAELPILPLRTRLAFWVLAGWLAVGLGYRPTGHLTVRSTGAEVSS